MTSRKPVEKWCPWIKNLQIGTRTRSSGDRVYPNNLIRIIFCYQQGLYAEWSSFPDRMAEISLNILVLRKFELFLDLCCFMLFYFLNYYQYNHNRFRCHDLITIFLLVLSSNKRDQKISNFKHLFLWNFEFLRTMEEDGNEPELGSLIRSPEFKRYRMQTEAR